MKFKRLLQLGQGFSQSLRFSNPLELLWQRSFGRRLPVIHYEWKGRWHLYCNPHFGDHGSVKELLTEGVYDEALRVSARGNACSYINVGANVGAFDVAVASRGLAIPHALSVELNPWTFARLAFNVALNDFPTLRLLNAGIAGEPGSLAFSRRENSVTDSIFSDAPSSPGEGREVALVTLGQALVSTGLEGRTFDLFKLDAECAEYDIIETAAPTLLRSFRNIVMELHEPPPGRTPERLYAKLSEAGFVTRQPLWTPAEGPALRFWSRADASEG